MLSPLHRPAAWLLPDSLGAPLSNSLHLRFVEEEGFLVICCYVLQQQGKTVHTGCVQEDL